MSVPPAVSTAFEGKVLLTTAETAALLCMCEHTLRGHVRRGEISFRAKGGGATRPRRMFGLDDVMDFLDRQRRTKCPPTIQGTSRVVRNRRSDTATSSWETIDFTALREQRRLEKLAARGKPGGR